MTPYDNVPRQKWDDMDQCVKAVLTPDFITDNGGTLDNAKPHAIAVCHKQVMGENTMSEDNPVQMSIAAAKWDTAYINKLPNSAFLFVESCYKEGGNKKARHFPVRDSAGKLDAAHVSNAHSRLNQVKPVCPGVTKQQIVNAAKKKLIPMLKNLGIGEFKKKKDDKVAGSQNVIAQVLVPANVSLKDATKYAIKAGFLALKSGTIDTPFGKFHAFPQIKACEVVRGAFGGHDAYYAPLSHQKGVFAIIAQVTVKPPDDGGDGPKDQRQ